MLNKFLYLLSAAFFGVIIYKNFNLLDTLPEDILRANLFLIFLALLLQLFKYLTLGYSFYINFKKAGVELGYWEVFKTTFVYIYVSVATPYVGAGGLLAFIQLAGHKNISRVKVGAGAFLTLLGDYLGFFLIIIFALFFFSSTIDDFPVNYIYAMLGFGSFLFVLVFLSIFQRDFLKNLFKKIQRTANWLTHLIHKKIHLDEDWAHRNVDLAHECFVDIKKDPKFYFNVILISLLFHIFNILTLAVIAWSFNEQLSFSKVVSSYVVVNTLETISPTPNGIGIIESFVPEFMTTIGVDFANSLIIITVFRFIYFYIPLFIGFYLSYIIFKIKRNKIN
jgi:uncharacterized protein (TIRG00374 family)